MKKRAYLVLVASVAMLAFNSISVSAKVITYIDGATYNTATRVYTDAGGNQEKFTVDEVKPAPKTKVDDHSQKMWQVTVNDYYDGEIHQRFVRNVNEAHSFVKVTALQELKGYKFNKKYSVQYDDNDANELTASDTKCYLKFSKSPFKHVTLTYYYDSESSVDKVSEESSSDAK